MTTADITQLIGSLGFPIVMCIMVFMDNQKMRKEHKEETAGLQKCIENNTVIQQQILEHIRKEN